MRNNKTYKLVTIALFTALLAVMSPFVIPIGPIPFSLGVFGVALMGAMLPPLWAMAGVAVYLLLGMAGLPVFTGFQAGPSVLFGVTGGYLVGYFLLALGVSLAASKKGTFASKKASIPVTAVSSAAGMGACYLLGTLWYMVVSGASFASGLALCVVPFIIPDAIKIGSAVLLAAALRKRIEKGKVGG